MIKSFFKNHKVHKKITQNMDWLFIFKIPYFFILWMIFCWGMGSAYYSQSVNNYEYFSTDITLYDSLFFLGLTLLLGGININNQLDEIIYLFDWPLKDNQNYKQQLGYTYVCPNFINVKYAKTCSIICIFIGVLIITLYSFYSSVLLLFYCYLNIVLYKKYLIIDSYKRLAFKCTYILITNFLLFSSGWVYFDVNSYFFAFKYLPLFIMAALPIILINEVISFDSFSKTEKEKRYFIYNDRKIIAFISFLIMVLLYYFSYSALFYDPITSHFSIITIPFLIYAFIRAENKDYIRLFTYAILVLNILLSWTLFPFLFVAQFFIFYLSKYYYWHRFNIHFPKFVIDEKD